MLKKTIMEEVPSEILQCIFNSMDVLQHVPLVNKIFRDVSNKVEKKALSLEELKLYVEQNYVKGILRSTTLVEKYISEIFIHSCKIKNRKAALYFLDFLQHNYWTQYYLYNFDDITLIKDPHQVDAAIMGALNILKVITDDPQYYIEAYAFLRDEEKLEQYKEEHGNLVSLHACRYNLPNMLDRSHINDNLLSVVVQYDNVDLLPFFESLVTEKILDLCVMYSAIKCSKKMLERGYRFTEKHGWDVLFLGHLHMIKFMCENGFEFTEMNLIELDKEAVEYLLDHAEYNKEEMATELTHMGLHRLAYKTYPTEERRLWSACETEDLETVKELYSSYEDSLFEEFPHASYDLCEILYRGESYMYRLTTFDRVKFCHDKGIYSSSHILDEYLVHGISLEVVKYLVERGAIPSRKSKIPRIYKYLDTV